MKQMYYFEVVWTYNDAKGVDICMSSLKKWRVSPQVQMVRKGIAGAQNSTK